MGKFNKFTQLFEGKRKARQKAIIYQSELDYISRCILDYPNIETGGQLFGYWTSTGEPVVLYAIGPGPMAQHNPTSFIQDQEYLQTIGNELHRRYRLQHVGEWHSHHQLGLPYPSGGDVNTMQYGVGKPGFPSMLLCIGTFNGRDTALNPYLFTEDTPHDYGKLFWDIVKAESPYRSAVDDSLRHRLTHPSARHASMGAMATIQDAMAETETKRIHWLTENVENVETMKNFVSMVRSMFPDDNVKTEITQAGEPVIHLTESDLSIKLPYGFPRKAPVLLRGQREETVRTRWEIDERPLVELFAGWLQSALLPYVSLRPQSAPAAGDEVVFGEVGQHTLTPHEESEIRQAEERTQRIAVENEILSENFHQSAFAWSDITETPVVNIVAFPFSWTRQGVVRLTMPSDFPANPPLIQFGHYHEDTSPAPTLPEHLAGIEYTNLEDLFENAREAYLKMLNWDSTSSMFKAYIVACILLNAHDRHPGGDVMIHLKPFLENENVLSGLISQIAQDIKNNKIE